MRTFFSLLAGLALLALLTGCSRLTVENFEKIKTGSEYDEVVRILGKPDSCSEALFVRSCVWGNEEKNISVAFMSEKVMLATSKNIR